MKRGTPRHPKVARLAELLGVDIPTAVGHLELLWHFTAEFAPQGDIGRYSDEQIAAACMFTRAPRKRKDRAAQCKSAAKFLLDSLIQSGWIDISETYRLLVHDWHEHADDSVRKRLHRAGLCFVADREKMSGQRRTMSDKVDRPWRTMSETQADNGGLPEPEPKPEPISGVRKLPNTPLPPNGQSPPPLTHKPEIAEQQPHPARAVQPTDGLAPAAALLDLGDDGPRVRRLPSPAPPPAVRVSESELAEQVVARMLVDWTEGRLGSPDRQIVQRILQAHDGELDAVHAWLRSLRRRGKRPESVQSWGWFVALLEAEPVAVAGGAG